MVRWFITAVVALGAAFVAGFAVFTAGLPAHDKPQEGFEGVDGVAALTGGGGVRIERAMQLFAAGAGERMLISGVHPDTPLSDLRALWDGAENRFQCCVDRGEIARTTRGNAAEIAEWARANGYDRIIIVTSDFHVPRSVLELRLAAPELDIVAVATPSAATGPGRSLKGWRMLASEYAKLQVRRASLVFGA
ncbi:MAG: YdcF family protein [Pseudomonadota bacterium]